MEDYNVIYDQFDNTLAHYALLSYCDPIAFQEATKDSKWKNSMIEKIKSIEKNNTRENTSKKEKIYWC